MKNLKNVLTGTCIALCLMIGTPVFSAPTHQPSTPTGEPATAIPLTSSEAGQLTDRYNEIKNMDKSEMTSGERKALNQESSEIKSQLKQYDGTVIYISSGVVIIVLIILLIILL